MNALVTRKKLEVVVVGGGYAGVLAANRAAGRGRGAVEVVLVSDSDVLVHRVRLHETATRGHDPHHPLDALLSPRVRRVRARAVRIDARARRVCLADAGPGVESAIRYDRLIYAVGSGVSRRLPGASENALTLSGAEEAGRIAMRIAALAAGARVVIVGAGLTGLEMATEVKGARPDLEVVACAASLAPGWDERTRALAAAKLARHGIETRIGARVACFTERGAMLEDGRVLEGDLLIDTTGIGVPSLARDSGLEVDASGRLRVDERLRALGCDTILGAGDAVVAPLACVGSGLRPLRMACATAMPMGAHAGDAVVRDARGEPPLPFRYTNTLQCVSFGRDDAMLLFLDADDRPTGRVVTGALAAFAKRVICAGVLATLRIERSLPGLYVWPGRTRGEGSARSNGPIPRLGEQSKS